jgi:hypothetical protein
MRREQADVAGKLDRVGARSLRRNALLSTQAQRDARQ